MFDDISIELRYVVTILSLGLTLIMLLRTASDVAVAWIEHDKPPACRCRCD